MNLDIRMIASTKNLGVLIQIINGSWTKTEVPMPV